MKGKIKSGGVDAAGWTLELQDGSRHIVAKDASVTLDGKLSWLGALQSEDEVSLYGDPVTVVAAIRYFRRTP